MENSIIYNTNNFGLEKVMIPMLLKMNHLA